MVMVNNNLVSVSDLKFYSGVFLEVLEREGIKSLETLVYRVHSAVSTGRDNEGIVISLGGSDDEAPAYVMDYVSDERGGILIEGRINDTMGYASTIIRAGSEIEGYNTFYVSEKGEIMQERAFKGGGFKEFKGELERLRDMDV